MSKVTRVQSSEEISESFLGNAICNLRSALTSCAKKADLNDFTVADMQKDINDINKWWAELKKLREG